MPQTTLAHVTHLADMVKDKTKEIILLELWLVISHSSLHVVEAIMIANMAVIKQVAEAMVADRLLMVEAVVVAEHPTKDVPLPLPLIPEIQIFHVMDVARIIMSWHVQPLQQNKNRFCYNRIDQDHRLDNPLHDHRTTQDKVPMVLPTMQTINKYKIHVRPEDRFRQQELLNRLSNLYTPMDNINHHVTWHLEHKYNQLRNKPVSFYQKCI